MLASKKDEGKGEAPQILVGQTVPVPPTPRGPKSETRNPKFKTRNPKPETRNPKPET